MAKVLREKRKFSNISDNPVSHGDQLLSGDFDETCQRDRSERGRDFEDLSEITNDITRRYSVNPFSTYGARNTPLKVDETIEPIKERIQFLQNEIADLDQQFTIAIGANDKKLSDELRDQIELDRSEIAKLKSTLQSKLGIDIFDPENSSKQKKARLYLPADLDHEYIEHLKQMISCLRSLHKTSSTMKEGRDKERYMSVFQDKIEEYKNEIRNVKRHLLVERRLFGDRRIGKIEEALQIAERNLVESDEKLRLQRQKIESGRHRRDMKEVYQLRPFIEPFVFERLFSQLTEFIEFKSQKNAKTPALRTILGQKDIEQRVIERRDEFEDPGNKKLRLQKEQAGLRENLQLLERKKFRATAMVDLTEKKISECVEKHKDLQYKLKTNENLCPNNIVEISNEIAKRRDELDKKKQEYSGLLRREEKLMEEEVQRKTEIDRTTNAATKTALENAFTLFFNRLLLLRTRINDSKTQLDQQEKDLEKFLQRVYDYRVTSEHDAFFVRGQVHTILHNNLLLKEREVQLLLSAKENAEQDLSEAKDIILRKRIELDALTAVIDTI